MAIADGELANLHHLYPKGADRSFQWQNGVTNRNAIVARDNLIEIYTNLVKNGEIDTTQPPKPSPPIEKKDKAAQKSYEYQLKEDENIIQQSQENFQEVKSVFTDGFLSMLALTQGGRIICQFDKLGYGCRALFGGLE